MRNSAWLNSLRARIRRLEESHTLRLFAIIGLIATPLGLWQSVVVNMRTLEEIESAQKFRFVERKVAEKTLEEIRDTRIDRSVESISRAWSVVTNRAPGSSGKVSALEYLASKNEPLTGIEVSCDWMGGKDSVPASRSLTLSPCNRPTWLVGLNISGDSSDRKRNVARSDFSEVNLTRANLRNTNITSANFYGSTLTLATFEKSVAVGANFRGADLTEAIFDGADLRSAALDGAKVKNTSFQGAHLSNAVFTDIKIENGTTEFEGAWAYQDNLPIGLPEKIELDICDNSRPPLGDLSTRPSDC